MFQRSLFRFCHGNDAIVHSLRPVEVDGQEAMLQGQNAEHGLDGTRGASGVSGKGLG